MVQSLESYDTRKRVDQATEKRIDICQKFLTKVSETLDKKFNDVNKLADRLYGFHIMQHMHFGVPDVDYLPDNVLDTAAITHGKLHKTLRDALKHIKDDLCRKGEEVEEDTKTVTEAAEAIKTAKAEKLDKDSTDIHISILEKDFYTKYAENPRNAYGKDSGVLIFHKEGSNQY